MGGLFFFTNIHGLMVVNPHKLGDVLSTPDLRRRAKNTGAIRMHDPWLWAVHYPLGIEKSIVSMDWFKGKFTGKPHI